MTALVAVEDDAASVLAATTESREFRLMARRRDNIDNDRLRMPLPLLLELVVVVVVAAG